MSATNDIIDSIEAKHAAEIAELKAAHKAEMVELEAKVRSMKEYLYDDYETDRQYFRNKTIDDILEAIRSRLEE